LRRLAVRRPARQSETPLPLDVLRLVEGIALTLAQEHHALEIAGKPLSKANESRSNDGLRGVDERATQ
jgi:hypothetical protein